MLNSPSPRQILATLLPYLRTAAAYSRQIQASISARPDKFDSDNFYATALTDADLSIQTFIEVALLGHFPNLRFFGEEHEKSYNTGYFRSIELGPQDDFLVTLDPVDGTRLYMDGHPNYQIILTILNADRFEAAIALSPALDTYYYTLRDQGTFRGALADDLEDCQPLRIANPEPIVLLGWDTGHFAEQLRPHFELIDVKADYSQETAIPNVNGILTGDVSAVILNRGKFIDGGALAFMAQEMGYSLSAHDGSPLPRLADCEAGDWPGLVVAATESMHQQLVSLLREARPE